jgi:hypothetical protein
MHDRGNAALVDAVLRANETTLHDLKGRRWTRRLLTFAPVLLFPTGIALAAVLFPSLPRWSYGLAIVPAMLAWMLINRRRHLRKHAQAYAATLLAHQRCASCGYSLDGATEDEFEIVKCPECAAAWKTDRIGGIPTADLRPQAPDGELLSGGAASQVHSLRALWTRSPSVADARQRSIPLITPTLFRQRLAHRFPDEVVSELCRQWRRKSRAYALRLTLLVLFFGSVWIYTIAGSGRFLPTTTRGGFQTFWPLIVLIGVLAGAPFWLAQIWRAFHGQSQRTAPDVARLLIQNGLCPACARDLPPSESIESITQCECGAAWKGGLRTPIR